MSRITRDFDLAVVTGVDGIHLGVIRPRQRWAASCIEHQGWSITQSPAWCPGVASLTYPPSSIPPGIINLGPTYRGYIQPRFNIPPGVYGT